MRAGFLAILILACLPLLGHAGEGTDEPSPEVTRMLAAYQQVDLSDGISQEEALGLAESYFEVFVSGCGGLSPGGIERVDEVWLVPTVVGFAAAEGPTLVVHAETGTLSTSGGPEVSLDRSVTPPRVRIVLPSQEDDRATPSAGSPE